MAHHVQQRPSSVYTLNPPVQNHQYQPNRRYVDSSCLYSSSTSSSSISNPNSNNRYKHYYHDQQQLLANRPSSRMETIRSSTALQHYYQDFHHAHPIMLPLSDMRGPLGTHIPVELRNIMEYIGGHYYSLPAAGPSQKKAIDQTPNFIDQNLSALCSLPSSPLSNGYHVQCLLLLGICAYARDKFSQANTIIHQAIELALKLGMHRDDFARANGLGQLAMEEMWRRTYWELYVVAGLLSGLRGQVSALQDTESDVLLPCDEVLYKRPESPSSRYTLEDFLQVLRNGSAYDPDLPSFGYRIEAVYNMGKAVAHGPHVSPKSADDMGTDDTGTAEIYQIETALTDWQRRAVYYKGKKDPSNAMHVEHMLFQTQIIAHAATIYLCQPKPHGAAIPTLNTPGPGIFPSWFLNADNKPSSYPHLVGNESLKPLFGAADSIASLNKSPTIEVYRHSPFLINGITLGMMVHMAVREQSGGDEKTRGVLYDHAVNALGVLKQLEKVWPVANSVRRNLNAIYRDHFNGLGGGRR